RAAPRAPPTRDAVTGRRPTPRPWDEAPLARLRRARIPPVSHPLRRPQPAGGGGPASGVTPRLGQASVSRLGRPSGRLSGRGAGLPSALVWPFVRANAARRFGVLSHARAPKEG